MPVTAGRKRKIREKTTDVAIFLLKNLQKKSQKGVKLASKKTQKGVKLASQKSQKGVKLASKKSQKGANGIVLKRKIYQQLLDWKEKRHGEVAL